MDSCVRVMSSFASPRSNATYMESISECSWATSRSLSTAANADTGSSSTQTSEISIFFMVLAPNPNRRPPTIARRCTERFFNAQKLIVFSHAIGAAQGAGFDLGCGR